MNFPKYSQRLHYYPDIIIPLRPTHNIFHILQFLSYEKLAALLRGHALGIGLLPQQPVRAVPQGDTLAHHRGLQVLTPIRAQVAFQA